MTNPLPWAERVQRWRDWLAQRMNVQEPRKHEVYLGIARATTLQDISYWLQVAFAAAIATLGLVLNSPAAIIGAMLISPLMGPILGFGLGLAAGDFVLLVRAVINLMVSSGVAIGLATGLVLVLPFREVTSEIAARTQPNTLDLFVALFSGAIGSLATCKPLEGVVTSIPGVAIAVALMPPLCVVGFGLGLAVAQGSGEGLAVAGGGGLLFLTNLLAIAVAAMLVFLALHLDTATVRAQIRDWMEQDPESCQMQEFLGRYEILRQLKPIGSLWGRGLAVVMLMGALLVPLSRSFARLNEEITTRRRQNEVMRATREVFQETLSQFPDGRTRGTIDRLTVVEREGRSVVRLVASTVQGYTAAERLILIESLAKRLQKPLSLLDVELIALPTVADHDGRPTLGAPLPPATLPDLTELRREFIGATTAALQRVALPPIAQFLDYRLVLDSEGEMSLEVLYLGPRPLSEDAEALLAGEAQRRLRAEGMAIQFVHLDDRAVPLTFAPGQVEPEVGVDWAALAATVAQHPRLRVEVTLGLTADDRNRLVEEPLADAPPDSESQAAALRQRRYEAVVVRLGVPREQVILAIGEGSQARIVVRR
ncbi:MAG: DUF389 domain-containing protein [Pseudanabaenaceae cyanobacterium]